MAKWPIATLWSLLWMMWGCTPPQEARGLQGEVLQFHGDVRKLGWTDDAQLPPAAVNNGLREHWSSPPLHAASIDGADYPPLIYASPLLFGGRVFTATSNGWVYAIDTTPMRRGSIVWAQQVAQPRWVERLDGGVPLGVLATPVIDPDRRILYVTALDVDRGWLVTALDLDDGTPLPDWPIPIDATTLTARNPNGPADFLAPERMSGRGALALSATRDTLFVTFGTFWGEGSGWLVSVDVESPSVRSAFSSAPETEGRGNGGIWGAGGPTALPSGDILAATGNSPGGSNSTPGVWGSSLLRMTESLRLTHHYTPFNYCALDEHNMDLGASQALMLPNTSLAAMGGKQGVVYLVDTANMRPALDARPPCSSDADVDESLLPPQSQPQFGTRGPLSVFGPYSERYAEIDHAKMRTRLAYFESDDGQPFLFASGSSKASAASTTSVPPSVVRLRVAQPGPHLELDRANLEIAMLNPGSPVVSSSGGAEPIVWVLDRNALRTAPALDPTTPEPVLYAFDGESLDLLWRSTAGQLGPSGKYTTPIVAQDLVIVATDRVQAFGP